MNEGLKVIGAMKDGVQKANESAYENRGIKTKENETKHALEEKEKEEEEKKELQKV